MKPTELHDQLLMLLLEKNLDEQKKEEVVSLINNEWMDWEKFLGKAFFNRVNGKIYDNIVQFDKVPREVMINLEMTHNAQIERVQEQKKIINMISSLFMENDVRHAFLKGSVLNTIVYPEGERISNDTDILISSKDINKVTKLLEEQGFVQGYYDRQLGKIVEASKKKKIFIRSSTHELCSFVRLEDSRFYKINTIDINIKLSVGDTLEATEYMLDNVNVIQKNDVTLTTLNWNCFFVQLASHLYREACLVTKIIAGSDMHMYKFYDFYVLLTSEDIKLDWEQIYEICKEYNQFESVYYAMYCVSTLFDGVIDSAVLAKFKPEDTRYIDQYKGKINTGEVYDWTNSFEKRFFDYRRKIEASKNVKELSKQYDKSLDEL